MMKFATKLVTVAGCIFAILLVCEAIAKLDAANEEWEDLMSSSEECGY